MTQETRNKVYAAAAAVLLLLLTLGVIDQATNDDVLTVIDRILDLVPEIVGLVTTILAWFKSRPSTTTVIDAPKANVVLLDEG